MTVGDRVGFQLGTGTCEGTVVKVNNKTVIVELPDGKRIKRHVDKHMVDYA